MSTIVTRAGKGSALTHNEVDANFNNLNNDKIEATQSVTLTNKTISGSSNTLSNIDNSSLTNSSVTIGSTSVSLGGTATTVSGVTLSSPTVSGGSVNNATIGATTPSTGAFTTLSSNSTTTLNGTTIPASKTLVDTDSSQTLTNKTLTTPVINGFTGSTAEINIGSGQLVKDTAGNLGLGVTPSASSYKTLEIGAVGNSILGLSGEMDYSVNAYYGSGAWRYAANGLACQYQQNGSTHKWFTATSGTAGNAITFTQAMTLDASGNFGIGTSSPSSYTSGDNLVVANATGNGQMTLAGADAGNPTIQFRRVSAPSTTRGYIQYDNTSDWLRFATNGSERMRLDSSGNLGLGVTPSAWGASWKSFQLNARASIACTNSAYIISNSYNDGSTNRYIATGAAAMYEVGSDGAFYWNRASSGTAGNQITFTQAMTLDASGNLGIGTTSPNRRLEVSAATGIERITSSTGTNATYLEFNNTSGINLIGNESSAGGTLFTGSSAYSMALGTVGAYSLQFATNNNVRATLDSSGFTQFSSNLVMPYQGAPTSKAAAATLTGAELITGILNTTGTTYTITLPTGTNIEGALTWAGNNVSLDWTVINTASGTITIGANGNTTLGSLTIATGTSAGFRIRRTAANTFTVYRMR